MEKYKEIKHYNQKVDRLRLYFSVPKESRQNIDFLCMLLDNGFKDYWLFRYLGDDASLEDGYKFFSNPENVKRLDKKGIDFTKIYFGGDYDSKDVSISLSLKDNSIETLEKYIQDKGEFVSLCHVPCENIDALKTLIIQNPNCITSIPKNLRNKKFLYELISLNRDVLICLIKESYELKEFYNLLLPNDFGEVNLTDKELIEFLITSGKIPGLEDYLGEHSDKKNAEFIRVADKSVLENKDILLELLQKNCFVYNQLDDERRNDAEVVFGALLGLGYKPIKSLNFPYNLDTNLKEIIGGYMMSDSNGKFQMEENMREYILEMKKERDKAKEHKPKKSGKKDIPQFGGE